MWHLHSARPALGTSPELLLLIQYISADTVLDVKGWLRLAGVLAVLRWMGGRALRVTGLHTALWALLHAQVPQPPA